jgi:predicted Zn-dependent protease
MKRRFGGVIMFLEKPETKHFLIAVILAASLNVATLGSESGVTQNLRIHKHLLKIALAKGRIPDADKEIRACLMLDPKDAGLHYDYGQLLWKENKVASALIQLRHAALLCPENAEYQRSYRRAASQVKGTSAENLRVKRAILHETSTDEAVGDFENIKDHAAIPPSHRIPETP